MNIRTLTGTLIVGLLLSMGVGPVGAETGEPTTPTQTCSSAGDASAAPTCVGVGDDPGVKPDAVRLVERKRSCKTRARVMKRVVRVVFDVAYPSDGGPSYWQASVVRSEWERVTPTPLGCRLRHKRWERNH